MRRVCRWWRTVAFLAYDDPPSVMIVTAILSDRDVP